MTIRLILGIAIGTVILALCPRAERFVGPRLPHASLYPDELIAVEDYAALASYSGRVTPEELDAALAIINPYGTLAPYLGLEPDGAVLYESPQRQVELARIPWRESAGPLPELDGRTVAGLRIVLDPGHFGGAFSEVERRHIIIRDREPVREGDLNWGTAVILKKKLATAGAEVILSRGPPPEEPFPEVGAESPVFDSDEAILAWLERQVGHLMTVRWLRDNPEQLTRFRVAAAAAVRAPGFAPDESFFAAFNRFDYRRRGLLAEAVGADLFLSLHHNISGRDWVNRLVVFVPGFIRWDPDREPGRYYAFRRALEGDLPVLVELAHDISKAMQRELEVPADQYVKKPNFDKLPLFPWDGVFARNLGVLRRATGPALLIEGPCMNQVGENAKLLRHDLSIDGRPYPIRVKEYANAVFSAVAANAEALWRQRERRRGSR